MNVWLLTNTPSSYQTELFAAIHRSGRCDLAVRFMRGSHRGRAWQPAPDRSFPFRVLGGFGPGVWSDAFRFHPSAMREILSPAFDAFVLSGQYTSLTFAACASLLARRRRPWAMWLERPWPETYRPAWTGSVAARNPLARRLRNTLLSKLLKSAPRVLCVGTAAAEAYGTLGAPRDRLTVLPYCCDTRRYQAVGAASIEAVCARHGLQNKVVFLFSGQMIERKGVDVLLAAFSRIAASEPNAALLLLGDGPRRASLEASVAPALKDRVVFAGKVPHEDLPAFYRAADVFVFPSRYDGWGVVLNEACAAGLPILTTDAVGAARDLVLEGQNGFVLKRDDVDAFAEKMRLFARDPGQTRAFGARGREIVEKFSLEQGVETFCRAIEGLVAARGAA